MVPGTDLCGTRTEAGGTSIKTGGTDSKSSFVVQNCKNLRRLSGGKASQDLLTQVQLIRELRFFKFSVGSSFKIPLNAINNGTT